MDTGAVVGQRLKQVINEMLTVKLKEADVLDDLDLVDDLGFDSLLSIELIIRIEKTFGIVFEAERYDIEVIRKGRHLQQYVKERLEQAS
jgi:acyl carrier protein